MKIMFASDLIKITFEENDPFARRSLIMYGEVLHHGFAANVSTMNWLSPGNGDRVSKSDKEIVCQLLRNYNKNSDFHVELFEE